MSLNRGKSAIRAAGGWASLWKHVARTLPACMTLVLLAWSGGQAIAAETATVEIPVSFQVVNQNHSWVACYSDGDTYRLSGRITGPASALSGLKHPAATLYLHGLGFASWFWQFDSTPGYDYVADLAKQGQVSVTIDRLGHGQSILADGRNTCIGAQADMAHQVVQQLKAGTYAREDGGTPIAFTHLALAGHSAGGEIAEVEAYSFGDIDALIVMSWADQVPSLLATSTLVGSNLACALSPTGYANFGKTDEDFRRAMFSSATPAVVTAATRLRVADPCGDLTSVILGLTADQVGAGLIQVPVLQVCGAEDALFPALDCNAQLLRYLGSTDKTLLSEADTGHAVTLETSTPDLEQKVDDWLQSRGL